MEGIMKKNRVRVGHIGGFRMVRSDIADRNPELSFDELDYDGRFLYLSVVFNDKKQVMRMDKFEMSKVKINLDDNSFKVYTHKRGAFRMTAKDGFTSKQIEVVEQLLKGVK